VLANRKYAAAAAVGARASCVLGPLYQQEQGDRAGGAATLKFLDGLPKRPPATSLRFGNSGPASTVLGPVDSPPWKQHLRLPGTTLTAQELPCRLRAPQVGRSLCGSGVRRPVSPSARSARQAVPILQTGFEQVCRSLEAGHVTNVTSRLMERLFHRSPPLHSLADVSDSLLSRCSQRPE
jgi:hypothetical protein